MSETVTETDPAAKIDLHLRAELRKDETGHGVRGHDLGQLVRIRGRLRPKFELSDLEGPNAHLRLTDFADSPSSIRNLWSREPRLGASALVDVA